MSDKTTPAEFVMKALGIKKDHVTVEDVHKMLKPNYKYESFEEWAETNEDEFELYCDAHVGWKAARETKEREG